MKEVYVGLGGNIGNSLSILREALAEMAVTPGIDHLKASSFYLTKPISDIPQSDYVNAVCSFETTLSAPQLLLALQKIEKKLGKTPKSKKAARIIDIDILLFKDEFYETDTLMIPHPGLRSRLFVLIPLEQLTEAIAFPLSASRYEQVYVRTLIDAFSIEEQKNMVKPIT